MDNSILIGIIVILLLIIAVIAALLFKQRSEPEAAVPQPQRSNKANNVDSDVVQSEAAPQNTTDSVQHADQSIAQAQANFDARRYDQAIIELKRILSNDATHSEALILLLTIYARTDAKADFDKLYGYIQAKADILTLQQAKEIKTSLDHGTLTAAPSSFDTKVQQTANPPAAEDNSLIFEDSLTTQSSVENSPVEDSIDAFNFDEDISFDEPSTSDKQSDLNMQPQSSSFDELSFDDTFEDTSTSMPASTEQPATDSQELSFSEEDDSEFSFDDFESQLLTDDLDAPKSTQASAPPSAEPVASTLSQDSVSIEDDFDLDFGDDLSSSMAEPPSAHDDAPPSVSEDTLSSSEDLFELSLDDELEIDPAPTESKAASAAQTVETEEELSFDLDDELETTFDTTDNTTDFDAADSALTESVPQEKLQPSAATAETEQADEISFDDDFSFDFDIEEDKTEQPTASQSQPQKTVELVNEDIDNNELTFDESPTLTSTPDVKVESEATSSSDFDDFDFDNLISEEGITDAEKQEPTPESTSGSTGAQQQTSDLNDLTFDDDDFLFDFDETPDSTSEASGDPKTKSTTEESIDVAQQTDEEIVLEWDEPLDDQSSTIQPKADSSAHTITTEDKPVGIEQPPTVPEPVLGSGLDDTLAQLDAMTLDDFSFDETPSTKAASSDTSKSEMVTPTESKSTDSTQQATEALSDDSFELDVSTDNAPAVEPTKPSSVEITPEPNKSQPAASIGSMSDDSAPIESTSIDGQFAEAFGFVEELDKSQITLDLAEQYLELGEYDSAKRLVNEVLALQSDEAHKSQAKALLERMN